MNTRRITVNTARTSDVILGRGLVQQVAETWTRPLYLVYDAFLEEQAETLWQRIPPSARLGRLAIPLGESRKTLVTVESVYADWGHHAVTRDVHIVALGGGVLTDLVGYAASTYLRGLSWTAIPTTLLAQVDAAIGGKVAVNTPWGKNLVGSFHLPEAVYIDADWLNSLPLAEWRVGLGEIIKSALIAGDPLYSRLEQGRPPLGTVTDEWQWLIETTATIKVDVVNQDLYESGPRMFLNFGHTVGHALERVVGYGRIQHGAAVAIGSLVALILSETHRGLDSQVRRTVQGWLRDWQLPTRWPASVTFGAIWDALLHDKKARQFGSQWVLLDAVGRPVIVRGLAREQVEAAIERLKDEYGVFELADKSGDREETAPRPTPDMN